MTFSSRLPTAESAAPYLYHDLLGLSFANEPTVWFEGPQLEKGVGVPDAVLRQVSL